MLQSDHSVASAWAQEACGLYPAADFRLTTGECRDCPTLPQALWYFRGETIAVPREGARVASFTPGMPAFEDLARWASDRDERAPIDYPPLIWVAAPQALHGVRLVDGGTALAAQNERFALRLVDRIPMNRSYWDASSSAFVAQHPLAVRGMLTRGGFVMRTAWCEDFGLGPAAPPMRAMPPAASPAQAMRALMREAPDGGARSPFAAHTLWQREPGADFAGKPVLAFMANGAQGDDDEAHAGHFAIVTGRVAHDGGIGDWLVNNFYSLDVESEKGILAAPVPLDNYLGDLNSGQAWYRPSYLLVLVLRGARAPSLVQSALGRVYNQFYRHRIVYYHPDVNCTSLSVDTLRTLGFPIARRGATSPTLAWLGLPFLALKERSLAKARTIAAYLRAEQTRLLPAAAFEEAFALALALGEHGAQDGTLARMVAEDLEAIAYLRVPQFPSSRAFGTAPVASIGEYRSRLPKDPALAQIIPLPPRPFPDALRDTDLQESAGAKTRKR